MPKHKLMVWKKGATPAPPSASPKKEAEVSKSKAPAAEASKPKEAKEMAKVASSLKAAAPKASEMKKGAKPEAKPKEVPAPSREPIRVAIRPPEPISQTPEASQSFVKIEMVKTPTTTLFAAEAVGSFVSPSPSPLVAPAAGLTSAASAAEETKIAIQTSLGRTASDDPVPVLEAALFMSGQALTTTDLAKLVGIAAIGRVTEAMQKLAATYERLGSALEVVEEAPGKWVMRVRAKYASSVRSFAGETEIPKHALRTLAYVSKNEGITKRTLFRRLGSAIYDDVGELIEKGFLSATPAGRTVALRTTPKFKQYFEG